MVLPMFIKTIHFLHLIPERITSYSAKELLVQSIQIEINRDYRNPKSFDLFQKTIHSLEQIINQWGGA
jgi:hypothetical protein